MSYGKTKKCSICLAEKLVLKDFYLQGQGYFTSECKECKKKRNAEYDQQNIEQKRKRAREYARRKRLQTLTNPNNK